jgi:hypothetical protein
MKKLLAKFGYIPKSSIEEFRIQLASTLAVNAELRETIREKDLMIVQLISDAARYRETHDRLKEQHETQQRSAGKLATVLATRVPIMMNSIRK